MKFKNYLSLTLILLFLASNSCTYYQVAEKMVDFDKKFIPINYWIYKGNIPKAQKASIAISLEWEKLSQYLSEEDSPELASIRYVGARLLEINTYLDAQNQEKAEKECEYLVLEMMSLRQELGMDYYLDYLYDFQLVLDFIIDTTGDEMFDLVEWEEFEDLVDDLQGYWQIYKELPLDENLYQWDSDKLKTYVAKQLEVGEILEDLDRVLCTADREKIYCMALNVKREYMELYAEFGNFNTNTIYFARVK